LTDELAGIGLSKIKLFTFPRQQPRDIWLIFLSTIFAHLTTTSTSGNCLNGGAAAVGVLRRVTGTRFNATVH